MSLRPSLCFILLLALSACGDAPKEDKAKEAVRDAVTGEFRIYQGAKGKLGEAEQREAERREQEKQLQ
ncbi:MAG TPA: hypothetical protein VL754_15575 [Verrucomicrobiae bacterium]|jgi:hypothetical protein|nr:hypothetical protein [Verrucomicrobiae bacterium]